jgi:holo-[acyl-carrier protein] synthase
MGNHGPSGRGDRFRSKYDTDPTPTGIAMITLGLGTQIVECAKVARLLDEYQDRFLAQLFTAREVRYCKKRKHLTEAYAALWAGKDAVYRALGTRWRKGMAWTDVELRHGVGGTTVHLHGRAKRLAAERGIQTVWISTSHTRKYAMATAIACG